MVLSLKGIYPNLSNNKGTNVPIKEAIIITDSKAQQITKPIIGSRNKKIAACKQNGRLSLH
jgi:hypothetical protein